MRICNIPELHKDIYLPFITQSQREYSQVLEERRKLREDSRRLIQEEVEKMERDLAQVRSVIPIIQLVNHLFWSGWLSLNLCRNHSTLIMILFFLSPNGFAPDRRPTQRAAGAEQREAGPSAADGSAASWGAAGWARPAESTSQTSNRASASQRRESAGEERRFRAICHILMQQVWKNCAVSRIIRCLNWFHSQITCLITKFKPLMFSRFKQE